MAMGILATPLSPVFTDVDGTANDTYTIPTTEGIDYLVGGILLLPAPMGLGIP
jgi:serine protease